MFGERDLDDWHAMRRRDYAEEGIPVILAVETVGRTAPRAGEPALAAAFRTLAEALADLDPDPAALIEILAARELRRRG